MSVDAAAFRRALGQFASGVTVVTTLDADGHPLELTVSSFCSVSLDPPLVLVRIDNRSEAHDGFEASGLFGVSVLPEGQADDFERFRYVGAMQFTVVALEPREPLVPWALAHIECRVHATLPGGDHAIYVGEVLRVHTTPGRPLLYHASAYHCLTSRTPPV